MTKLQPVRGTHDLLPDEFAKFFAIQTAAREISERYGFREMATPIFEFTDVFKRTMGETSDVVTKEMYEFQDRGGESICLRPEFTAGIVRSLLSNSLTQDLPQKLFSTGPVFRYERPQKGRQRQFHQLNIEHIGARGAVDDVEVIAMAAELLQKLGIKAELQINSLGDTETRKNYHAELVKYFTQHREALSDDSKTRLEKNPMRILDSKDEGDRKLIANAPMFSEHFSETAQTYFETVQEGLRSLGLIFTVNEKLVRGLDYYSHTVFEFVSGDLGAQNTVLAGGRYDGLVSTMGGPEIPAVGWGAGLERLLLLADIKPQKAKPVCVIAGNEALKITALEIAQKLRANGKMVEIAPQANIGKALKFANKIGAFEAYILGEQEVERGVVQVKNLETGAQTEIKVAQIGNNL